MTKSPAVPSPPMSAGRHARPWLQRATLAGLVSAMAWAIAACGGGGGGGPAPSPPATPLPRGVYIFYPTQAKGINLFEVPDSYRLATAAANNLATGAYPIDNTFASIDGNRSCVYVANQDSNDVSTFNTYLDGTPSSSLPRIAAGTSPSGVGMDSAQANRYVYVTNFGSDTVSRYRYEPSTCQLTALGSSATQPSPSQVRVFGKFAVIASYDNTLQVYEINLTDGSLTALGAPLTTGGSPYYLWQTGANTQNYLLHTANETGNSISGFALNIQTGALASTGADIAVGQRPQYLLPTVLPNQTFVIYVLNRTSRSISTLRFDNTAQQYVKQGADIATQANPFRLSFSPSLALTNRYLYAYHDDPATITVYEVDQTTGALKALGSAL